MTPKILTFILASFLYFYIGLLVINFVYTYVNPYLGIVIALATVVFFIYICYKLYKKHAK